MKSVFQGALIVIITRWVDRFIGFVSTLILARLLAPGDFGVVSIAWVFIGLFDVLLDLGINITLIQKRSAGREEFDSAWTIGIIQGAIVSLTVFLSAPLAAEYFRDERVTELVRILAPTTLIGSFINVGIINFQKDMQFDKEFRFFFLRRILTFIGTVTAAALTRSYWGLVIGSYVSTLSGVTLSYLLHPYRPSLSTSRLRELWSFSQWNMVRSIGGYVNTVIDRTLLGRRAAATEVGHYQMANEIAAMPSNELLAPVGRALFPAFARAQDDRTQLRRSFLVALSLTITLVLPAGIGLFFVAPEAVLVLLGPQWVPAIDLLRVLALASAINACGHTSWYLLLATTHVRELTYVVWAQVVVFVALALLVAPAGDAASIAQVRLVAAVVSSISLTSMVLRYTPEVRLADFGAASWRPVVASAVMGAAVMAVGTVSAVPLVSLVVKVALGALVYALLLLALWRLAGRPEGAEHYLLDKATNVIGSLRASRSAAP